MLSATALFAGGAAYDVFVGARGTDRLIIAGGKTMEVIRVLREREGLSLGDAKQRVEELRRKASSR